MKDEFFLVDEVAMMRFMSMCHQSCDPEMWKSFMALCQQLIEIRPGLRNGCFERIEAYLHGSASKWPIASDAHTAPVTARAPKPA